MFFDLLVKYKKINSKMYDSAGKTKVFFLDPINLKFVFLFLSISLFSTSPIAPVGKLGDIQYVWPWHIHHIQEALSFFSVMNK